MPLGALNLDMVNPRLEPPSLFSYTVPGLFCDSFPKIAGTDFIRPCTYKFTAFREKEGAGKHLVLH